jgi:hypothetical protein
MKDIAYIKITVQTNSLGVREAVNYEWGGKSPYTYISPPVFITPEIKKINGDKEIQIGPYRLLKVKDAYHLDCALYVRKDKLGALRVALYKSNRLFDMIYRRLIITLAVWKLADFSEARVPTWQDIYLLKGFAKK